MKKFLPKLILTLFFISFFGTGNAQNQTVVNGVTTTAINFPASNCGYTWTNDHPEIGLPLSGSGDIASFTAVNTGTLPVTAIITATPVTSAAYAYITNNFSNDVSVINTKTRQVIATIPVGVAPFGVSASKDGSLVYITINAENRIAVISTITNTVINTIPVGKAPYGVVVNLDGTRVYVANGDDNTVSVINTVNSQIIATIPVGQTPYGVTTSHDGAKVYVTNYGSNNVSVIDAASNSVVATVLVGSNPTGVAVGIDGKYAYVCNSGQNTISIINTASNVSNTVQAQLGAKGIVPSPDGSRIYFSSAGFLSFLIPPSHQYFSTASRKMEGVSVTPDGSDVYFVDYQYNAVYIVNPTFTTGFGVQVGNKPIAFGNFISSGVGSCTGAPVTLTITVNPSPTVTVGAVTGNILACQGTPSSSPNVQKFTVSGSGLTGNITAAAPGGFEVSINPASGYSSNLSIMPTAGTISETIYVRSSGIAPTGSISGNIVLSSAGMADKNVAVTGIVNELLTVNAVANQVTQGDAITTAIGFTGSASNFSWVNNTPGIGLPAGGVGDIAPFKAINSGSVPITATITVTPIMPPAYAYITNVNSNDVSIINTKTRQVIKIIPVGLRPFGVSASKDGNFVYVTIGGENKVSVISTITNAVINTITVGKMPAGVFVSPDGSRLYVCNSLDNTLSVINIANNQIIATIPVEETPHGVTTSLDGGKVYVTNYNSYTVSVIDAMTNSVVDAIKVGERPTFITVGVDGKNIYVANTGNHSISVINAADYSRVDIQTPNALKALVSSPDGKKVFFSSDGFLHYITLPGNELYSVANNRVEGVSITPDGAEVYFVDFFNNQVYIANSGLTSNVSVQVGNGPVGFGNFISTGPGSCPGAPITFTITVNPRGSIALSGLTTTYGTPSSSIRHTVSGTNVSAPFWITPPFGFEVSLNNTDYGEIASINPIMGNVASVPFYVRLKATTKVGNYAGGVEISTSGRVYANLPIPNSTVNPAPLTITANNTNKVYGATVSGGSGSRAFSASGLQNEETVGSVTITYINGSGVADPVGVYPDAIEPSLATGGAFLASNYDITYINGTLTIIPETINPSPSVTVIPNAFTPNNDGINDIWSLPALAYDSKCLVQVYSRWGELVFQSRGYANHWDGTRGGTQLPAGIYYYLITPGGNAKKFSGQVTIIR